MLSRHIQLFVTELKQSKLLAALPFALLGIPYAYFLLSYMLAGVDLDDLVIALMLLQFDKRAAYLPLVGISLLGYLSAGNIFQRASDVFLIKDRHHLSKACLRASTSFLFFACVCAAVTIAFAPELYAAILLISARALAGSLLCLWAIAFVSYLFRAVPMGVLIALGYTMVSYGTLGVILPEDNPPVWHTPELGFPMINYFLFASISALSLFVLLIVCERYAKRASS